MSLVATAFGHLFPFHSARPPMMYIVFVALSTALAQCDTPSYLACAGDDSEICQICMACHNHPSSHLAAQISCTFSTTSFSSVQFSSPRVCVLQNMPSNPTHHHHHTTSVTNHTLHTRDWSRTW